jgi:hypothetical protein
MSQDPERDTVPRLQQLVPHMQAQLLGLREGATFEQARRRYISTVDRLVARGQGRRTASRVGDQDAFWAPTQEVLDEAMRLGLAERQPLPSSRAYLDAYRDKQFALTELGRELSDLAQSAPANFYSRLTSAVYQAHPYFRRLLQLLQTKPLICPETTEGEVEENRKAKRGTPYFAEQAAERIGSANGIDVSVADVQSVVSLALRRRFGKGNSPSSKALSEALNGALLVATANAVGLRIGATELKVLRNWGAQLRIIDQSRYIPKFARSNVIWLAADIVADGDTIEIKRRGLTDREQPIAAAIIESYRESAQCSDSKLSAPYVPIYQVRAAAAFACGVTRALVDMVIEQLAAGDRAAPGVRLLLHLGTVRQPASEPVYRRGGTRRYEMTINNL